MLIMVDDERLPLGRARSREHAAGALPHARLLPVHRRDRVDGDDGAGDHPGDAASRAPPSGRAGSSTTTRPARWSRRRRRATSDGRRPTARRDDIERLPRQQERKELLRLLTAGSVDDGKSTLIGRLLYDTQTIYEDQLAAVRTRQRAQGARPAARSICRCSPTGCGPSASRASPSTSPTATSRPARRKFIIADCPGHEQYTRNMATGASNCDLAIILIDARHGVLRQTRRHSFIVSLLGIRTSSSPSTRWTWSAGRRRSSSASRATTPTFATRLEIGDLRVHPALRADAATTSSSRARTCPGTRARRCCTISRRCTSPRTATSIDLRFPVQYVNRPNLDFRGFSGTVASGVVRAGRRDRWCCRRDSAAASSRSSPTTASSPRPFRRWR